MVFVSNRLSKRIPFILGAMVALFIGTAQAADQYGELRRHSDNAARLTKINPQMRPKVAAVIRDLESHGDRPVIDAGVWRTPAQQAAKVRAGNSKVRFSFHNCSTRGGAPDSLAADISDARFGWNSGDRANSYWLRLASAAQSHNLTTGIYWGLSPADRARIRAAIAKRDWAARIRRGWDAAHCQITGISLPQAERGVRPR